MELRMGLRYTQRVVVILIRFVIIVLLVLSQKAEVQK